MATLRLILVSVLVSFLSVACQTEMAEETGTTTEPAVDPAAATEALNQLADQYESTYNARDAAGIAAMYVEDATWFAPDGPRVDGVGAIQRAMEETYASMPELSWSLESEAYAVSPGGDTATGHGTFHMSGVDTAGQEVDARYQWVADYRNVDGTWKITRVMWNQGGPAMESGTESEEPAM